MKKLISLEEMLVLTPYQFSNKFFVRKPKKFTPYNKGLVSCIIVTRSYP